MKRFNSKCYLHAYSRYHYFMPANNDKAFASGDIFFLNIFKIKRIITEFT